MLMPGLMVDSRGLLSAGKQRIMLGREAIQPEQIATGRLRISAAASW